MPDASWKAFERRVATWFGGKRRGVDTGGGDGGRSDVIAPGWSIECKLLGRPGYADLLAAARQAEKASLPTELPIGSRRRASRNSHHAIFETWVVKRKRALDEDALVVMRAPVFREWFGPVQSGDEAET